MSLKVTSTNSREVSSAFSPPLAVESTKATQNERIQEVASNKRKMDCNVSGEGSNPVFKQGKIDRIPVEFEVSPQGVADLYLPQKSKEIKDVFAEVDQSLIQDDQEREFLESNEIAVIPCKKEVIKSITSRKISQKINELTQLGADSQTLENFTVLKDFTKKLEVSKKELAKQSQSWDLRFKESDRIIASLRASSKQTPISKEDWADLAESLAEEVVTVEVITQRIDELKKSGADSQTLENFTILKDFAKKLEVSKKELAQRKAALEAISKQTPISTEDWANLAESLTEEGQSLIPEKQESQALESADIPVVSGGKEVVPNFRNQRVMDRLGPLMEQYLRSEDKTAVSVAVKRLLNPMERQVEVSPVRNLGNLSIERLEETVDKSKKAIERYDAFRDSFRKSGRFMDVIEGRMMNYFKSQQT